MGKKADSIQNKYDAIKEENDFLLRCCEEIDSSFTALAAEYQTLAEEHDDMTEQYRELGRKAMTLVSGIVYAMNVLEEDSADLFADEFAHWIEMYG